MHVAAARDDGVALDRLALEGVALGGPVLERAGLEVEVERLAVGAEREGRLPGALEWLSIGQGGTFVCRGKQPRQLEEKAWHLSSGGVGIEVMGSSMMENGRIDKHSHREFSST